jgi:hypothetical protein
LKKLNNNMGRQTGRTAVKKYAFVIACALALGGVGYWVGAVQTVQAQAELHPRLAAAVRELEEAIRYMEAAPHDFGGHKAAAIRDSRATIVQLRAAMAFRPR